MTLPMEALYPCAKAKLLGYLPPEHTASEKMISRHLELLKKSLTAEQYERVAKMMEECDLLNSIELESMFQAAFSVALDLLRT